MRNPLRDVTSLDEKDLKLASWRYYRSYIH